MTINLSAFLIGDYFFGGNKLGFAVNIYIEWWGEG